MKRYKTNIFSLIITASIFSSCTKEISLDFIKTSPKIVIEGNVYDQPGPYIVKLSKSISLDETGDYPAVSGAIVIIRDNAGNVDTLKESISGTYKTSSLQGIPGRTYSLMVIAESKTYSAKSNMPFPVNIDTLSFVKSNFSFGSDSTKELSVRLKDPVDTINYYRFVEYINDIRISSFNVSDDRILEEGNILNYSIQGQGSDNKLKIGDKVTMWLESVDKDAYEYFRTAGRQGGQSASPTNPTSNINNDALGYFSACSVTKKSSIVTK